MGVLVMILKALCFGLEFLCDQLVTRRPGRRIEYMLHQAILLMQVAYVVHRLPDEMIVEVIGFAQEPNWSLAA